MGRPGAAQRGKKAEKAKVKLKGHATKFLPKGKNITNTTFKVRKIVLQDQLKTPDGTQPLTKRKLNIKEVFSKFDHYSSSQRQEGLHGLSQLLSQMDMGHLTSHLSGILDGLAKLSLDSESSVRRQSAQILAAVFPLVKETQLLPFSSVLGSYLSCAMTHIKIGVQEDSLLLFDALLENAPGIAAASANQLLPCVLDMISQSRSDHNSSRELSVQLSSNLISSTWRAKVFGRLQALLVVSLKYRKEKGELGRKISNQEPFSTTVNPTSPSNFPLYNSIYATPVCLPGIFLKSMKGSKQLLHDDVQLRAFVDSIMPLMLDSWMEVNPQSSQKSKNRNEDPGLPLQSALILHCVLEIIDLLWQHLVSWDEENARQDLTTWFKTTYFKEFNKFLGKGFPYSARSTILLDDDDDDDDNSKEVSQGRGRRRLKTNKKITEELAVLKLALPYLLKDKDEHSSAEAIPKCVLQNLTLCHLLTNLCQIPTVEVREKIFDTLISYLNQWSSYLLPWSDHLLRALRSVFEKSSKWGCNLDPLLAAVVSRYHKSSAKRSASHQALASQLCDLLGEVSVLTKFQHVESCESFHDWIVQLPASLGTGQVTLNKLCIFNKLASMNNVPFLEGLHSAFDSLLGAVSNFELLDGENHAEKEAALASLFYWINKWNGNQINALRNVLSGDKCSSSLSKKISSILLIRKDKLEKLENTSWLEKFL